MKKKVVIGILGTKLDAIRGKTKQNPWRPTVSIFQHKEFKIDRLELLFNPDDSRLAETIKKDVIAASPKTVVKDVHIVYEDPWAFEEVYGNLLDFTQSYKFNPDKEEYYVHISTGTHTAQICMFALTEARFFPAKLLQTSPSRDKENSTEHCYRIIDLALSGYDKLTTRFSKQQKLDLNFLKSNIQTKNRKFNTLIEEIELVAQNSKEPMLLSGPTGVGKTKLARKIFEMKKQKHQVDGEFVELNCATVRGDMAYSSLFGHNKGSFTGAHKDRAGLMAKADGGILFLDEIGELGLDEQAMLLKALEDKEFLPLGSDTMVKSDFQLMAGTNIDLHNDVSSGKFRDDLFARINLWHFPLPTLKQRPEDLEPNIQYELEQFSEKYNKRVYFNTEAEERFLTFAKNEHNWEGNFRDLRASILRMATLAPDGRIDTAVVQREIERYQNSTGRAAATSFGDVELGAVKKVLGAKDMSNHDPFDLFQLERVIGVCVASQSMAEAGRTLFAVSRLQKNKSNDSDRLKKYLAKFGVGWRDVKVG
ncbi:MAG: RNA repair transcriptional activator RtcR [Fibrobacterales bacterium]